MSSSPEKRIESGPRWLVWWRETPLYVRILAAVLLGVIAGALLGAGAAPLATPAKLVLRILGALAPPLILFAIVQALMSAPLGGGRLFVSLRCFW